MEKIIVWHNLNNDTYYYKVVKCFYRDYEVGYINQYNHKIIIIIPLSNFLTHYRKITIPHKVIKRLISFLQKIEKKL